MGETLFPTYLNRGSKGPAVAVLQTILKARGCDPQNQIIIDGDYGNMTMLAVQRLQNELGVEADGNFGPQTRAALRERTGLDINRIPASVFVGETEAVAPTR